MEYLKRVTDKLYRSILFKKDGKPYPETLNSLFISESKLIHHNSNDPVIMPVNKFTNRYTENINYRGITEFNKCEVSEKKNFFGNTAKRFSSDEAKAYIESESNLSKEINSIRFIKSAGIRKYFLYYGWMKIQNIKFMLNT